MSRKYDYCQFTKIHSDCFALQADGRCFCLDDTDFKDKPTCPFYKLPMNVDGRVTSKEKKLNAEIERRKKVVK